MPIKSTTVYLLCILGVSGSGSSQLRKWLEEENEKYDLCEEEKWTTFSFDEIDVPSRYDENRIIEIIKNIKQVLGMVFIDDCQIRSNSRMDEILTVDNFYNWFEKCNSSFHDCIEALLYNEECLNIQQDELNISNCSRDEINKEIDMNVWLNTLQPYILEIIKKIFDTTCVRFVFDIGNVFYPEKVISVIEDYILDEKKLINIEIIEIESDYKYILNRWMNEITNKDEGIPSENYSIYEHDIIRNKVIEMAKCNSYKGMRSDKRNCRIERNDEYLRIRFLNSINEIKKNEMLLERLKRFLYKILKEEISKMKEMNDNNIFLIGLNNRNKIHRIVNSDDELSEFYTKFVEIIDELYGKRVKYHGVLQYVSDDEDDKKDSDDEVML